jgi:cellulose 1,4-beta-cellobiosidase
MTSPDCTDTATLSGRLAQQYGSVEIPTTSGNKSYLLHTNWWHTGTFNGQSVNYQGLSFVTGNPNAISTTDNNPMGYPSFFIGTYAGHTTSGSNLPKLVSSLTSVPTVLSTNSASMDYSNHNAAYDVWFTDTSAPLSSGAYSPPAGGAFLMVWLYKPTNRQPRGNRQRRSVTLAGVEGTWDVWVDSSKPPCISYVSTETKNDLAFDLNTFIKDSVTNQHGITNSMYLSIVFAGFEVWGGGDGVAIRNFCVNVK